MSTAEMLAFKGRAYPGDYGIHVHCFLFRERLDARMELERIGQSYKDLMAGELDKHIDELDSRMQ